MHLQGQSNSVQPTWKGTWVEQVDPRWNHVRSRTTTEGRKRRWRSTHPIPRPCCESSYPHNYTGPQIERQFSLFADLLPFFFPVLLSTESIRRALGSDGVFRCEKRQFVRNLREHWSNDKRITGEGLGGWTANSVIAKEAQLAVFACVH